MTSKPILYAHPFSSYSQKVLMAVYETSVDVEVRVLSPDHPDVGAEFRGLWPIAKFPLLAAGARVLMESTIIIEWLDHLSSGEHLIPADPDLALEARMLDRIFDNYVMTPMMTIVGDRLRPEESRDTFGVKGAHDLLDRALPWIDDRMASRTWALGDRFSVADCAAAPALFYANWVHPLDAYPAVESYLTRLRTRPSFHRCVEEARPYRDLFPGSAPLD